MALVQASAAVDVATFLTQDQITKAALSLVRRIDQKRNENNVHKVSLLDDQDEENGNSKLDVPLWLVMTAKEPIATSHTLIPAKIVAPHALYSSPDTRICLITADPPASSPKAYKELKDHPEFPQDLKTKIRKVVRYSRLAKKYKSYESRRQLLAEYDVFLADDRIIHLLPPALGSVFYKSTTKRPIAVSLIGKERWGKKLKKSPLDRLKPKRKNAGLDGPPMVGKPADVGHDIEVALSTMVVNLSPSPSLSVKVAYAGWPAEWIAANVEAVVGRVVAKYIPGQIDGLKSLHLKGADTAALPIYMADAIWDEDKVLDDGETAAPRTFAPKTKEQRTKDKKSKAKLLAQSKEADAPEEPAPKTKKRKKTEEPATKKSKKQKGVVLEPQDDEDPEESRKKKETQEKLIEEVAKKMKLADKEIASQKDKKAKADKKRKEKAAQAEATKEDEPAADVIAQKPPSPKLKFDVENWKWEKK